MTACYTAQRIGKVERHGTGEHDEGTAQDEQTDRSGKHTRPRWFGVPFTGQTLRKPVSDATPRNHQPMGASRRGVCADQS
jgi:hypothetical protein